MSESVGLIIFAGGIAPAHPLLRQMHTVRQACARDLLRARDRSAIVRSDRRRHRRSDCGRLDW